MQKIDIAKLAEKIGEKLDIIGWVNNFRDHGKVFFIDLRDRTAIVQLVTGNPELIKKLSAISKEDLLKISGEIKARPEKLINENIPTGKIEVEILDFEIISKAKELPFAIEDGTEQINELSRLQYRYLDLRTDRMQRNLKKRHQANLFMRNYLDKLDFTEVETPFLTKGTPEGAREYIVPSRLHEGSFYVLPQSPQQLKQLLMVGGVEKYFQIVKCFRDEDQRQDRQPEFTQLDIETSFWDQEDILQMTEKMMLELVKEIFPEAKIQETPFPRLTYKEAMEKYNSDKPDLRKDKKDDTQMAFAWVVDFPLFEYSETEKKLVSAHHPFTMPQEEDLKMLEGKPQKVRAKAYDLVLNGYEIGGGSIRIFQKELQQRIFKSLGLSDKETKERFGHMLEAFEFSPPPHGGIALGLDRLFAILLGEKSIREVMAFPKTGDAKDPLTGAPTPLPRKTLKEAHIKLDKKD